jgi:integrase
MEYRGLVARGIDPVQWKREQRGTLMTFAEAADAFVKAGEPWSDSNARDLRLRLKTHAVTLLTKSVAKINRDMVEDAIRPLMLEYPKQGRRTLNRLEQVFAFAIEKGWRADANPAMWKGSMAIRFHGARKLPSKKHAAMDYALVPAFIQRLRQSRSASAVALECVILTACRTSEIRCMAWPEISWNQCLLTIPAARMKTRTEHTVPLCDRMMELLRREQERSNRSPYVFTGRNAGQPLDEKAIRALLRDMGEQVTVHGFRSSFRSWAAEQTTFDFYAVEMCLSHSVGSAVTQAYLRGNAIDKRRPIMDAWSVYCGSATGGAG